MISAHDAIGLFARVELPFDFNSKGKSTGYLKSNHNGNRDGNTHGNSNDYYRIDFLNLLTHDSKSDLPNNFFSNL